MRLAALTIALAAALLGLAFAHGWLAVPPDWAPWVALDLEAPPNPVTRYKLAQLSGDRDLCARVLAAAEMTYRAVPDEVTGEQCGLFDAVTVERTTSEIGQLFSLTCRARWPCGKNTPSLPRARNERIEPRCRRLTLPARPRAAYTAAQPSRSLGAR
jgi:hypothetical protein